MKNADGTFTSAGPDGGRTAGDILLNIDLAKGGDVPEFDVMRWQSSGGGFDFAIITPPANTTFVAANNTGSTSVPFGAFGSTTYNQNQFGEAAIDLTALIENLDACIGISTLLIKTAASASASAALMDFIEPIPVRLGTNPIADAGPDQSSCQNNTGGVTFTLNGTALNGPPVWSVSGTTGTASAMINSPNSATTDVKVTGTGTVTLQLSVTSANCGTATDEVVLTVSAGATAMAGDDQVECQDPVGTTVFTLNGLVTNGSIPPLWSVTGTTGTAAAMIVSPDSPSTDVNVTGIGTVTLQLKAETATCGTATDEVVLTVNPIPTAAAGTDQTLCQDVSGMTIFTLNGAVTNGDPMWNVASTTGTAAATIVSPGSAMTDVKVTGTGTVTLELVSTSTVGCGSATDEVILTVNPNPTASAGTDQSQCQDPSGTTIFSLNGSVTNGTPLWTVSNTTGTAGAMIVDPSNAATDVKVTGIGTVTLKLTATSTLNCGTATDEVVLTVKPNPTADAGTDQTKCQDPSGTTTFTLAGTATNGDPMWSVFGTTGSASPTIVSLTSLTTDVKITGIGTVTLHLTASSTIGCGSATDEIVLTVNQPATVDAGPATLSTCGTSSVQLNGSIGGSASGATWTTSGTGTFSPTSATLNAVYNPSAADLLAGTVMLTLTTDDPVGPCPPASDSLTLTLNPNPSATIISPTAVCAFTTNTASVPDAGMGATYLWSLTNGTITNGQGTSSISWAAGASSPATISVVVTTAAGCQASNSQQVVVNPLPQVTVNSIELCVNDQGELKASVTGGTGPYSYLWTGPGNFSAATQSIIVTMTGTYTVTVTDANGCPVQASGEVRPGICSVVSDQKAGSLLIYPLYTSSAANPATENTRLHITNTNTDTAVILHLFFVDGSSCSVADSFLCLTPNQTAALLASDIDPGIMGYMIAIAVDANGCPVSFNYLIGDEYTKFSSGHAANLGAEAFAALYKDSLPGCNATDQTTTIRLDGVQYDQIPRVLAVDNIPSPVDGNSTMLVIDRIGGSLITSADSLGPIFGLLFNDRENGFSFTTSGGCQIKQLLSNNFPRTTPRLPDVIPPGHTGWMKLWTAADTGILGVAINANPGAAISPEAYTQGHNLHKLTLTRTSYLLPIVPPHCG